jgi:hypothetical protein
MVECPILTLHSFLNSSHALGSIPLTPLPATPPIEVQLTEAFNLADWLFPACPTHTQLATTNTTRVNLPATTLRLMSNQLAKQTFKPASYPPGGLYFPTFSWWVPDGSPPWLLCVCHAAAGRNLLTS